jgi:hypothetical protein
VADRAADFELAAGFEVAPAFPAGRPAGRAVVLLAARGAVLDAVLDAGFAAAFAAALLPDGVGGLRSGMVLLPAADGNT